MYSCMSSFRSKSADLATFALIAKCIAIFIVIRFYYVGHVYSMKHQHKILINTEHKPQEEFTLIYLTAQCISN